MLKTLIPALTMLVGGVAHAASSGDLVGEWDLHNAFVNEDVGSLTLAADGSCTATFTDEKCNWKVQDNLFVLAWRGWWKIDIFDMPNNEGKMVGYPQANPNIKLTLSRPGLAGKWSLVFGDSGLPFTLNADGTCVPPDTRTQLPCEWNVTGTTLSIFLQNRRQLLQFEAVPNNPNLWNGINREANKTFERQP